jgi:hypothetical protein
MSRNITKCAVKKTSKKPVKGGKVERSFMRLAGSLHGLPSDLSQRKGYSRSAKS